MPGLVFSMFSVLLLSLVAPGLQQEDEKDLFTFPDGYDVSQDDDNYV